MRYSAHHQCTKAGRGKNLKIFDWFLATNLVIDSLMFRVCGAGLKFVT